MRFLPLVLILYLLAAASSSAEEENDISGEQSLKKLLEGNARYVSGDLSRNDQNMAERRSELVAGQEPFAVIVGCSDSRVSPEIIFDQGLGDIFIIRTAGQVMDNASLGSIEYAVEHLEVPLIVVLGHDGCGAVSATVKGEEAPGHMMCLVESIQPSVDEARQTCNESELLDSSIDNNIKNIKSHLSTSNAILSDVIQEGRLLIVGARYHLDTGVVQIIE